jgi:hypothetical protein
VGRYVVVDAVWKKSEFVPFQFSLQKETDSFSETLCSPRRIRRQKKIRYPNC